jgi:hydroxymethylglutaryl-CoA reductase
MAGSTQVQVSSVRSLWEKNSEMIERIFDEIGSASLAGYDALINADYARLGAVMNLCHGLLNALQVSTPLLEEMVHIARTNGALGAKLTGAGGGGSVVALCPGREQDVSQAFRSAGFEIVEGLR